MSVNLLLKSLYLKWFRNYVECEFTFSSGVHWIHGGNGVGKTNLLEAIALLSSGRSFRNHDLKELVQAEKPLFLLEASFHKNGVSQKMRLVYDQCKRTLELGKHSYSSFTPLLGTLPCIVHTPLDQELVSGAPAVRRRFLNLHLAQSDPLYVHHLIRYGRAMKQRNALLKGHSLGGIECWEHEMACSALYLLQTRTELVQKLHVPLERHGSLLSGGEETYSIRYHPSFPQDMSLYTQQLERNRPKEMGLGLTLTGPHRDDVSFWVDRKGARFSASEGQKRSLAIALRLAEFDQLKETHGRAPLFGVDDFDLFLDPVRKRRFEEALGELGQTFITTPVPRDRGHLILIGPLA